MKRTLITSLALTLVATLAIAAPPRRPDAGPGPAPGGREGLPPQVLAEFLALSDAQIAQAQALRETLQSTAQPLHEQLRANHEEIEAAVAAGDAAKAGQLLIAGAALRAQLKAAHDTFRNGFTAILTAEQKAKFAVYEELKELRRSGRE
ncbi:MAG TPA: Spy/CpxP family protein refolding chaperone [Thermoanaerobaculia bacterium]|nr:Spy/CpxP family protein refolding chaperone [Thermoanaerobaculia bacterium]